MSLKQRAMQITDGVWHIIKWEDKYSVEERQSLNDKVDEYVERKLTAEIQSAREDMAREIKTRLDYILNEDFGDYSTIKQVVRYLDQLTSMESQEEKE